MKQEDINYILRHAKQDEEKQAYKKALEDISDRLSGDRSYPFNVLDDIAKILEGVI